MNFPISNIALDDVDLPGGPRAWLGHVPFALWLVEQTRPAMLVELGTHYGLSYFSFCSGVVATGLQTKCFAVDTWQGDEHAGIYGEEVYAHVNERNGRSFHAFSSLLRMTFDEAAGHFADGTIDVLHIDGLHTYEAVRHDFETWKPKLSSKAVVLFHDTNVRERDFGVWRLWEELGAIYPHLEFQHSHGLGVLFVGEDQPEALRDLLRRPDDDGQRVVCKRLFARLGQLLELQAELRANAAAIADLNRRLAEAQRQIASAREEQEARARQEQEAQEAAQRQLAAAHQEWEREHLQRLDQLHSDTLEQLRADMRVRDEQVAALMAERAALLRSGSWKLTALYRWLGRALYEVQATVRLLPAASRQAGGVVPLVRNGIQVLSAEGLEGVRRRARDMATQGSDEAGRTDDGR